VTRGVIVAIAAMVMVMAAVPANASTKRIAVIVGNNAGNAEQSPLHYAETDAAKFAGVLTELGGVFRAGPQPRSVTRSRVSGSISSASARIRRSGSSCCSTFRDTPTARHSSSASIA
jgi:hypothetical protein